tara:strand:+ start:471 stop:1562 length:1092 start_codon:yes stop_codon:yes gene_type:complete
MKQNIGVIFGGPSPEHDISVLTGLQAARILSSEYNVFALYWSKDNKWYLNEPSLEGKDYLNNKKVMKNSLSLSFERDGGFYLKKKKLNIDVLVNACHGGPGEDGRLQSLLDIIGIPYTGPDHILANICMDKYLFTTLLSNKGLPVLDRVLIHDDLIEVDFEPPYIVKPRFGGSSIGVEIVGDLKTAKALIDNSNLYSNGAVVEKYLEGCQDYLLGVMSYPSLSYSEIEKPIVNNNGATIYNYEDKYLRGRGLEDSKRELPANLSGKDNELILSLAKQLVSIIGSKGVMRIDFIKSENNIYINEVNSIPGSFSTYLWSNTDLTKFDILNNIVLEAINAVDYPWQISASDGRALSSADDIQSKLE